MSIPITMENTIYTLIWICTIEWVPVLLQAVKLYILSKGSHSAVTIHLIDIIRTSDAVLSIFLYMVWILCHQGVLTMSDRGPLVPQLTPNPDNISKIERTASLALITKKYDANLGVNRMKNGDATAVSVKHKWYSFTSIMYYLKDVLHRKKIL